ncbi:hypothetical protein GF342_02270 [Candidatus Woesearchaeota archaeon]|nr:hypothetical protein [Candidatus Woesearchaeota archaeon]
MNVTGRIRLENLSFIDPKPTVDYNEDGNFVDCPASLCTEVSYSNGTFVFDVAHFTSYGVAESYQVPEFSMYALFAAMILIVGGFLVMRKR